MIRKLLVTIAFVLSGCGGGYRDTGVAMTSMAVFDPVRFAGLWYEVARFPVPLQAGCTNTQADYAVTETGVLSVRNSCRRNDALSNISGEARVTGPGRLKVRLDGVPVAADYWVLWIDEGYRTAVVGTPSGRAGWILNRTPEVPPDRLRAAREVLRFNGYDLGALQMTPQDAP